MGYWAKDGSYVYDEHDYTALHHQTLGEKWENERISKAALEAGNNTPFTKNVYIDLEIEKERAYVKQREEYYGSMSPELRRKALQNERDMLDFVRESIKRIKSQVEQTQQKLEEVSSKKTNMFNRAKQQKEIMMLQEKLANEQAILKQQQAEERRMLGK